MKIIKESEWLKNKEQDVDDSGPVVLGPKVVEVSSVWQSISK